MIIKRAQRGVKQDAFYTILDLTTYCQDLCIIVMVISSKLVLDKKYMVSSYKYMKRFKYCCSQRKNFKVSQVISDEKAFVLLLNSYIPH